jgi:TRAP-type C4-dicarboxylate transport system permease small subunit
VTAVVNALANAGVTVALIGELGAGFANVISRSLFDTPFLWTDEVAKLALSTIAFVSGAIAYAQGHHAFVRVGLNALGPRLRDACLVACDLAVPGLAALTGYASIFLIETRWNERTPILEMPAAWTIPLSAGMALVMFHAAERLVRARRNTVVAIGGIGAVVLTLHS